MIVRLFRQTLTINLLIVSLLSLMVVPTTIAQDTNICRDAATTVIEYDETLTSAIDVNFPLQLFCFDAERGDEISVTVEPTSGNLIPIIVVATPFVSSDENQQLVDPPLAEAAANTMGGDVEVSVNIDDDGTYLILVASDAQTLGSFDITLELGEVVTLGGGSTSDDEEENNDTSSSNNTADDEPVAFEEIVPGETNLCNTADSVQLTMDEATEGTLSGDGFPAFLCFEANAGDIVTIEAVITDGNAEMGFLVTDPFFDFSPTANAFAQAVAANNNEPAVTEFIVRDDGQYLIILFAQNGSDGDYTLTVSSAVANVFNCQNEPLTTLTATEWGILDADSELPLIEVNIGCAELLSVSTMGAASVSVYSVEQDGTFIFIKEDRVYETVSLSANEWVIERDDGVQFTLVPISDADVCTAEEQIMLIHGSWLWNPGGNQSIVFDFTCNGMVIIDLAEETFAVPYAYDIENEEIVIELGAGETLTFEEIEFDDSALEVEFEGNNFDLENRNFVEPEATESAE